MQSSESREESGRARIRRTGRFGVDDIELLRSTFEKYDLGEGTPWDDFRDACFELPPWFEPGLDPRSQEYSAQQKRLWGVLAGVAREYDPAIDEREAPFPTVDHARSPGHFVRRDPNAVRAVADHFIATGMIMKHCNVKPGDWALEYGAGFAQTSLQLARLGVNVDTVDISSAFCQAVRDQAELFRVPLTAFHGHFGWNPRGQQKYDLILFYESFHHCLEFLDVVPKLKQHLAPGGRIVLAGEPVVPRESAAVPYPWGLRLHSSVVAVIRQYRWFELGFTEDFLFEVFANAGFSASRMACDVSTCGEGYVFSHRPDRVSLGSCWLPPAVHDGWYGSEAGGRWTKRHATLPLDCSDSFDALAIEAINFHPFEVTVDFAYGAATRSVRFGPRETRSVTVSAREKARRLEITADTYAPAHSYGAESVPSIDTRPLGIFVTEVRYERGLEGGSESR